MKWRGSRKSTNIEDRRGTSSGGSNSGGGLNPMLIGLLLKLVTSKKGLIIVGIVLAVMYFTGNNPLNFITGNNQIQSTSTYNGTESENELADFTATVLANTEDVWKQIIPNYREPSLVLFSGSVTSACGGATSATGPFYCPGDEKIYIDLSFFEEMGRKLNAPGDFAQAYVIAHEVGHHIQSITGINKKVQSLRGQISQTEYNKYSVMLELQADFYAGIWAHHFQKVNNSMQMEDGDLEEALNAAHATGDDILQEKYSGRVVPDSFTHGTSAQRMRWFKKGFDTGDVNQGDTFNASSL
ncbi:neutral zinc metallopeptidase [Polaribacter sp. Asnod1-A03]|uniref:KPN_02809 family neutral zinc metallopeptidase n=1 Tax=Polaribacter sp. Asnod1-A03 TaxID=3160581 RepID=UPI00386F765D